MRDFGPEVTSVAVLTPYKAQLALLKSAFAAHHSKSALANVEFATVDGFQVIQSSDVHFVQKDMASCCHGLARQSSVHSADWQSRFQFPKKK